jgi:hypothetical protein
MKSPKPSPKVKISRTTMLKHPRDTGYTCARAGRGYHTHAEEETCDVRGTPALSPTGRHR